MDKSQNNIHIGKTLSEVVLKVRATVSKKIPHLKQTNCYQYCHFTFTKCSITKVEYNFSLDPNEAMLQLPQNSEASKQ